MPQNIAQKKISFHKTPTGGGHRFMKLFRKIDFFKGWLPLPALQISREGYRQKVASCTPNSFVMVKYKTFHLKHYIVFVKICPPTGQLTFQVAQNGS